MAATIFVSVISDVVILSDTKKAAERGVRGKYTGRMSTVKHWKKLMYLITLNNR